jgi:lipopolysaccharide/colanic/teichoic acid biosynthesis glycosyltransferase
MSLIGPRPCLPYEYDRYLPWQQQRFNATPGLTGLWQVSGKNRTTFDEMIHLDIKYAETQSFWLDAKIIFMTIPAILRQIFDTEPPAGTATQAPSIPLAALSDPIPTDSPKGLYSRRAS